MFLSLLWYEEEFDPNILHFPRIYSLCMTIGELEALYELTHSCCMSYWERCRQSVVTAEVSYRDQYHSTDVRMTQRCDRILDPGSSTVWLLAFLLSFPSLCRVFRVQRTGAWTGHDFSFVILERNIDFMKIFERPKVEQPKCVFHFELKHCFNKCFWRSVCACVFSLACPD